MIFLLLLIGLVVGRVQSLRQQAAQAAPTPALAYVLIATSTPIPTAPPPTPDGRVLEELAALRAQVAQLQAAQQAPPEVVYVPQPVYVAPAPVYVEQAAPTPEPYQVASEPPPTMAPQTHAILDRAAWAAAAATARAGR